MSANLIMPVVCVVCGKHAHCYQISYPIDAKYCEKCHTRLGPWKETVDFCSWACMEKWLDKRRQEAETK
jgi:hypothetical protein